MDNTNPIVSVAVGLGAALGVTVAVFYINAGKRSVRPKREPNTVYVHVIKPNRFYGLFCPSVWCMKVETWLRIANIPHETIRTEAAIKYSPDGTLPFIEYNGVYVAQHQNIVEYLVKATGTNPDAGLSPQQAAKGYVVEKLIERFTHKMLIEHDRIINPAVVRRKILTSLPIPWLPSFLLEPVMYLVVRNRKNMLGISEEKRRREVKADISAISDLLGEDDYITGAPKPSSSDATLYAFLVNAMEATVKDEEIARWMNTLNGGNMIRFVNKMRTTVWKDWWSRQEVTQYRTGS